jgi:glucose/arabinose dehydrogenase
MSNEAATNRCLPNSARAANLTLSLTSFGDFMSRVSRRGHWMTTVSSPTTEVRIIAAGLEFPEGPVAMTDGSVLVTEIAAGTLTRVSPDGRIERIAELGGGPNGAAIGPDGAVYVCNNGGSFSFHRQNGLLVFGLVAPPTYSGGSIDRVDLVTGAVTTLYRRSRDWCGHNPVPSLRGASAARSQR